MSDISKTQAWHSLAADSAALSTSTASDLFKVDLTRFDRFSIEAAGLFLDYSKNKVTENVVENLIALAVEADVEGARKRMFSGESINHTENRAVLHPALRDFSMRDYFVDGVNVSPAVRTELEKLKTFCNGVHAGTRKGYTGKPLDTIVNIGIGGSDLGPQMIVEALRPYWLDGRRAYFVSNVDGQHLYDTLDQVDPETTLFIVASKTFTTQETMTNANSAKDWFLKNGGIKKDIAKHFVALSTNRRAVENFGIDHENMFVFWDWVGGRYSLWSAIGLSIALQVGFENFEKLLRGAHALDEHFRSTPLGENMPIMLALIGVWNRNFIGAASHAVLPYDQHLHRLPAYLQQADMESNGKSVTNDGTPVSVKTGPVIFGEPGTNGQHAFYQLLHQGTDVISADFIASAISQSEAGDHHQKLLSNFLAQTEALMQGKTTNDVRTAMVAEKHTSSDVDALAPHKTFTGDRPTNSILFEKLTPEVLGALIALYEHKIFVQGVIWDVNSFDQWGVELGKTLAKTILPELAGLGEKRPNIETHDASTKGLLNRINKIRGDAK